jgi:hypothetical protein
MSIKSSIKIHQIQFDPLVYYNKIHGAIEINGGLSFNEPTFNASYETININDIKNNNSYDQIIQQNENNCIIKNVNKLLDLSMITQNKIPITIDRYFDQNIHNKLNIELKGKGVIDMLLKKENDNRIFVPKELMSIVPIIESVAMFEKQTNPDIFLWNMWILIDIRPIRSHTTQRNAGYHYDGFNLNGRHKNKQNVSIYGWTNKLPTLFYTKGIKIHDLNQYENPNLINLSMYAHMKADYENFNNVYISEPYDIIKFDGITLHAGNSAKEDITDRVFMRICFTPPSYWFDRKGNTINPYIAYPNNFTWQRITDPSVKLISPICFASELEFKRAWDVACYGHHAFSICLEGYKSYQYKLITEFQKFGNKRIINHLTKLYDTGKTIDEYRLKILLYYYELYKL